ncbi:phage holin family protein [Aerococcus sp. HMSC23C02]|uniref:phage holin family protein n=1 Tax=Aerococcus sp. HMSC23C02 TaxID=1581058 RepID=UPI0008A15FE2|nr:phage holin family protein [Aerococcus sp. HMSC23C02]OFT95877.1 hypothetical protein HMPREF3090_03390 [Aerococcus sp. HMSC23C02]
MINIDITKEIFFMSLIKLSHSFLFQSLLWLILADVISGYGKAFKLKVLDSSVGTNGLIKHTLVVFIMTISGTYAKALGLDFASNALGFFFISGYAVSFIENLDAIGVPIPSWISQYFNRMRSDYDAKVTKYFKEDLKNRK